MRLLLIIAILTTPLRLNADSIPVSNPDMNRMIGELINSPATLIAERIQDSYTFYGLASYYNNVNYYIVDINKLSRIDENSDVKLVQGQWLSAVGRFNVLLIKAPGLLVRIDESILLIDNPESLNQFDSIVTIANKPELLSISPELDQLRYAHLWAPFSWLAKVVESTLGEIRTKITSSWGLVIIIFSIFLKLLLLPISIMTVRFQRRVSQVQAQLMPLIAEIKEGYDGEEAHLHLMAAYKKLGVSPFFTLKPMLGSFIQIPILIAIFNALGEMPQFSGQAFLWIEDLAYPDAIWSLPFSIPLFGNSVNLLPFLMTAITLFSTVTFQNRFAPETELERQKRNLYMMAAAFFVLFYPFPAVMVLFWALSNILQIIQQRILKI